MKSTTRWCCLLGTLTGLAFVLAGTVSAADLPEAPKVSSFAPATDLAGQLEAYVDGLQEGVKDAAGFEEAKSKLTKDANTVLLIALGLGLSDKESAYKEAAPALVEASKKLMAAKDYEAAKGGVQAIKEAMTSKGDPSKLSWKDAKDASLAELMKQVPLINTKLKRNLRQFKQRAKETAGQTAVIAVIGQGSMPLAGETQKPSEAEAWFKHCTQMRDAAGAVNAAIHAKDQKAAEKAMTDLAQSCDDCHAVFNPKEKK